MDIQNAAWRSIGHAHVKKILDTHLAGNHLAHAYLFAGPKGAAKRLLVHEFAQKIVHPVSPQLVVSKHDVAALGAVEDIRGMLKTASLTPAQGDRSVVILDNMHTASAAVANALLKTLEEPNAHTIFLLISDTVQVMPTVMSRCQLMQCGRLSIEELKSYAIQQHWTVTEEMVIASAGSVVRLAELAQSTERGQAVMEELSHLRTAIAKGDAERMLLVQRLANLDEDMLMEIIEGWTFEQSAALKTKPQRFAAVQTALETTQRLKRNINKKMALTYFVMGTTL